MLILLQQMVLTVQLHQRLILEQEAVGVEVVVAQTPLK
jgi:hypothetical protein